jgi:hypothetical protein
MGRSTNSKFHFYIIRDYADIALPLIARSAARLRATKDLERKHWLSPAVRPEPVEGLS